MYKYILFIIMSFSISQNYDYSLEDLNPSSITYQENIGTSYFEDIVTLHYFGHFNWGLCTARFGQLENLYQDLLENGYDQLQLIGVGKFDHLNLVSNWTNSNDASVCADSQGSPVWNDWGANQRDLYIIKSDGSLALHQNISSGLPDELELFIIELITNDSDCIDGEMNIEDPCNPMECFDGEWIQIVIDCEEEMGIPCDGGLYIDPPLDECCSTCIEYGDCNFDGDINVLDTVIMVNQILQGEYNELSDINFDDNLDVLDLVSIITIILGMQ